MRRVLLLCVILVAGGCGVATPAGSGKSDPPKVEPKSEPSAEVYDKVAPMPREAKRP